MLSASYTTFRGTVVPAVTVTTANKITIRIIVIIP
jgi:hypothetical protein